MNTLEHVRTIVVEVLALSGERAALDAGSALLGSLPELDSMAVVSLIGALEEHFGISIADDDISADSFATLGSLAALVERQA
jgi:acyl carrier protein